MLLCDLFRRTHHFRATPERLGYPPVALRLPYIRAKLEMDADIGQALNDASPCFVLEDDVIAAAAEALLSRPRSIYDCLTVLRVPWPVAFIEWREQARCEVRQRLGVSKDNGELVPARAGFLLEAEPDGRRGRVRICWSHAGSKPGPEEECYVAPLWFLFDFDHLLRPAQPGDFSMSDEERRDSDLIRRWSRSPSDIAALDAINRATTTMGVDTAKHLAALMVAPGQMETAVALAKKALSSMYGDVSGEAMTFMAVLILLTSRNGVETKPGEDRTKLNKIRRKRGESPLLQHVRLSMRLSRAEKAAVSHIDASGDRASPRMHMVCGHPVRRGETIFWRRAHARGMKSGRPSADTRTVLVSL